MTDLKFFKEGSDPSNTLDVEKKVRLTFPFVVDERSSPARLLVSLFGLEL
jgi:hypothetical protein